MLTIGQKNESLQTEKVTKDAFKTIEQIIKNMEKTGELNNLTKEELIEEELLLINQLDLEEECLIDYDDYSFEQYEFITNKTTISQNNNLLNKKLIDNRKRISIM